MKVRTRQTPAQKRAQQDRDKLQGAWNSVSGRRPVQLLVAGNHYLMKFKDGDLYVGTFQLDVSKRPKVIDMTIDEGPERHRGKTAQCIYRVTRHQLCWCPAEPGRDERLKTFPDCGDSKFLCTVFEREED